MFDLFKCIQYGSERYNNYHRKKGNQT